MAQETQETIDLVEGYKCSRPLLLALNPESPLVRDADKAIWRAIDAAASIDDGSDPPDWDADLDD